MSVVNRIRIGFALPLILLTLVGAISYQTASQITEATRSVEHTQALIAKLRELTVTLGELVKIYRSVLQTGKTRNEQTHKVERAVGKHIQELRELTADNSRQQARLDDFTDAMTQWNAIVDQAIAVRDAQGMKAAEELFKGDDVRKLGPRIQGVLRDMDTEETALLQHRHLLAKASAARW